MINYITKDITTVNRGIIAHGCNCQGVMGSGVARFLRDKYPQIFPAYSKLCFSAELNDTEDSLLGVVDFVQITPELIIANCFTQHLYGYDKSKYALPKAIETSLETVYKTAVEKALPVYLPKIGAGRGGLDWTTEVEPIIQKLSTLNATIDTYVCVWAE